MKKSLIIGLATLALTGTAFIGSNMYAASSGTMSSTGQSFQRMERHTPADMINSPSGKASPEALTALQTLMTKHQTEMDALKNSGTQPDKATMDAQRTAFKTEMDALIAKYPELKTALPQVGNMGRGGGEMESILAALPADAQASIQTIRDSYKTRLDALRTEEDTQVEAILANYPDVKAKYDAEKANRPTMGGMGGWRGKHGKKGF